MNFTYVATFVVVAFVIISDIPLALDGEAGNTYSEFLRDLSYRYAVVPTFGGVVVAHWFCTFGQKAAPGGLWILIVLGIFLFLVDFLTEGWLITRTHPALWLQVGQALGAGLWALRPALI